MKTASDSIAVIRTRLPYLDRRALSEAWFSALHLAGDGRLAVPQRRAADPGYLSAKASAPAPRAAGANGAVPARAPATPGTPASRRWPVPGRADPASPETRTRVRRSRDVAPAAPIPPPLDASFRITIGGARVQMLVRRDGPTLRITAICAASNVEAVRRALASADVAMRLRGHLVESRVRSLGDREAVV